MAIKDQAKTASELNVLAAIWLIISPFVLGFAGMSAATNAIIIGIIVGVLALVEVASPESGAWLSWINIILGVWMLVSPFILGAVGMAVFWNSIILGIVVIIFSGWNFSASSKMMMT